MQNRVVKLVSSSVSCIYAQGRMCHIGLNLGEAVEWCCKHSFDQTAVMSKLANLITDLTALSNESKRRAPQVRIKCDELVTHLKQYDLNTLLASLSLTADYTTSLLHIIIDLCASENSKIILQILPVAQKVFNFKLVGAGLLPSILDALAKAAGTTPDILLRILQCLPPLMLVYAGSVEDESLIKILSICCTLTKQIKFPAVQNTASATLQQLLSDVFDDQHPLNGTEKPIDTASQTFTIDTDASVTLYGPKLNMFLIFQDLCLKADGKAPTYLAALSLIKTTLVLEIIESILSRHRSLFEDEPHMTYLVRASLVPILLNIINSQERLFSITVRAVRICHSLVSFTQLSELEVECELILSCLNHMFLNAQKNKSEWEMDLILELYRGIFADFTTTRVIFDTFDARPHKRGIIKEFLLILSNLISETAPVSFYLKSPAINHGSDSESREIHQPEALFSRKSDMKIAIIDHLDKSEPPSDIPNNYHMSLAFTILISLVDGISAFVQSMSAQSGEPHLEIDVDFISALIPAIHPDISAIFKHFLYSLLENDSFHHLVRALQRLALAIGLLGLKQQLDDYLAMLAAAITTNSSAEPTPKSSKPRTSVTNLQELGKQLLAFGGSLVGSLSSSLNNSQATLDQMTRTSDPNTATEENINMSRAINARQIVCLRALTNIAISLGSTLQDSWLFVWKAFQWCNYFISGADEFSGFFQHALHKNHISDTMPAPSINELESIAAFETRLIATLADLRPDSYTRVLEALIALSLNSFGAQNSVLVDAEWLTQMKQADISQTVATCPFNKTYFLTVIKRVSGLNSFDFLLTHGDIWQMVLNFFVTLGSSRSLACNVRIFLMKTYYEIVKRLASLGFGDEAVERHISASTKTLDAICLFLQALFKMEAPRELLVLNCETELHLLTLTTLRDLIEKYDTHYTQSCVKVFWILNTPFRNKDNAASDNNLDDKRQQLVNSSFGTLKLILDEFLSSLPSDQLKLLVDSLCLFGAQKHDLNTSFSAISYFWLIADSIKLRMNLAQPSKSIKLQSIDPTEDGFFRVLEGNVEGDTLEFYCALDVFLLHSLIKHSLDSRSQVRDGLIQTFYQILDAHTPTLQSVPGAWDLAYDAVIIRNLETEIDFNEPEFHTKEWVDSIGLHLTGLVSLCGRYMIGNDDLNIDKWCGIIGYFKILTAFKWPGLNINVFRAFNDLLIPFPRESCEMSSALKLLFFDFWVNVPTDYDLMDKLYAESLIAWLKCFESLYPLVENVIDDVKMAAILTKLNKSALYPVLPQGQSDSEKPTLLQRSVLEIIHTLSRVESPQIQSSIVSLLSQLMVSPYTTRDQLRKKLTGTTSDELGARALFEDSQIPTFTAMAHICTDTLGEMLRECTGFDVLLESQSLHRAFSSLLEIIDHHTVGNRADSSLWVEACALVEFTTEKMLAAEHASNLGYYRGMWELVSRAMQLRTYTLRLTSNTQLQEELQIAHFDRMSEIVVPRLLSFGELEEVAVAYIGHLYKESFFYEFDELELMCLQKILDPFSISGAEEMVRALSQDEREDAFGLARPLKSKPFTASHAHCLDKLSEVCGDKRLTGVLGAQLKDLAYRYCMCRALLVMRRLASGARVWSQIPVTKLLSREVTISLQAINHHNWEPESRLAGLADITHLYAAQLIPFSGRVAGLAPLLTGIICGTHGTD